MSQRPGEVEREGDKIFLRFAESPLEMTFLFSFISYEDFRSQRFRLVDDRKTDEVYSPLLSSPILVLFRINPDSINLIVSNESRTVLKTKVR